MALFPLRDPFSALSHAVGLILALPATWILWRRCVGQRGRQVSLLIYGLTLALCYACSVLFHAVNGSPTIIQEFNMADRIGIFLLIAGTYTPIAWNLMAGHARLATLALAWSSAAAGSMLLVLHRIFPDWVTTVFYLMMGWGAVLILGQLQRRIGRRSTRPIILGGLLYSVGAGINFTEWPDLFPESLGYHGIFHLFVLAGSMAHFTFLLRSVAGTPKAAEIQESLPFARPQGFPGWPTRTPMSP